MLAALLAWIGAVGATVRRFLVALFRLHLGIELAHALGVAAERFGRHRAVDEHGQHGNPPLVFEPLEPVEHLLDAADGKRGNDHLAAALGGRA